MIICHGCGREFDPPAGFARTKIRCSECGVYCVVAVDAATSPTSAAPRKSRPAPFIEPESAVEDQAAAMLQGPNVVPWFDEQQAPPSPKPKAERKEMRAPCPICGAMIRTNRKCPICNGRGEELKNKVGALELGEPSPQPAVASDEDDAAYLFTDRETPHCPQCNRAMPLDSVLCARCGFNRKTRDKAVREYRPVARSWDADMSLQTRLKLLAGAEAFYLVTAAIAVWSGMEIEGLFIFWATFTALLTFILGTFDHITLTRDRKGRTKLIKRWRAFFVPLPPATTNVHAFAGVKTGQWYEPGMLEWLICFCFLPFGIIPAIIWWYNAIYKPHFHVALALDHGQTAVYVYRGRSEDQMNDIADAVADVGGLRRLA